MAERRTTERLLADADARLAATERLDEQLAAVRGRASDERGGITAEVTVHGALRGLDLHTAALSLGPEALGAEITRVIALAHRNALRAGAQTLGDALGDGEALSAMRDAGLGDEIEPDAPVLPYTPGVDPNAHTWISLPPDA